MRSCERGLFVGCCECWRRHLLRFGNCIFGVSAISPGKLNSYLVGQVAPTPCVSAATKSTRRVPGAGARERLRTTEVLAPALLYHRATEPDPFVVTMDTLQSLPRRPRREQRKMTATENVSRARAVADPFAELQMTTLLPYSRLQDVRLRASSGSTLEKADCEWMLSVVKELKSMYEQSSMGWDEAEKRKELYHREQRFLIASHEDFGERIGFLSYRFDVEEGQAVMYVYELGVSRDVRGKRLAFALMKHAEDLCSKLSIGSIMLTVFLQNQAAMSLYRDKLKYVIDESSPSQYGLDDVGYEVLRKKIES